MSAWAKRGLHAAIFTGGMLAVGAATASVASAAECCPDRPVSPIGGSVEIPVLIGDNAVGTPLGEFQPDAVEHTISSRPVSDAVDGLEMPGGQDPWRGNRAQVDVALPVHIAGNAIAAGGDADVDSDSSLQAASPSTIDTTGDHRDGGQVGEALSNNVGAVALASPVALTGNAVAAAGDATSQSNSYTGAQAGGPIRTDGRDEALAGNVVNWPSAVPVNLTGNAVSWFGDADTNSTAVSDADAGGDVVTNGDNGPLSGNIAGGHTAMPAMVDGNAVSWAGEADAISQTTTTAVAQSDHTTSGVDAPLGGNIAAPALAGPAEVAGNAASLGADTTALSTSDVDTVAGGTNTTDGRDSVLGGNLAAAPVSTPSEFFGNGAALGGSADAAHAQATNSVAGGNGFTRGDDSVLGGNAAASPVAVPVEVFGNGAAGAADVTGEAQNTKHSMAGGFTGSNGTGATGGGNAAVVPVALPVQGFGNGAAGAGEATGLADNDKMVGAGGDVSTDDDFGFLAGNAATAPIAGPVEVFGNAVAGAADAGGVATSDTDVVSGGDITAAGDEATAAGNVVTTPVAIPTQLFGMGASGFGTAGAAALGETTSTAGGDVLTSGRDGTIAGLIAAAPVAGVAQGFGNAATVGGTTGAAGVNDTAVESGGDLVTDGTDGTIAGSIVEVPATPVAQAFANAAAVAGEAGAIGDNTTTVTNNGTETTRGEGFLTGETADVPAFALVKPEDVDLDVAGDAETVSTDNSMYNVDGVPVDLFVIDDRSPELDPAGIPTLWIPVAQTTTARSVTPDAQTMELPTSELVRDLPVQTTLPVLSDDSSPVDGVHVNDVTVSDAADMMAAGATDVTPAASAPRTAAPSLTTGSLGSDSVVDQVPSTDALDLVDIDALDTEFLDLQVDQGSQRSVDSLEFAEFVSDLFEGALDLDSFGTDSLSTDFLSTDSFGGDLFGDDLFGTDQLELVDLDILQTESAVPSLTQLG